MSKCDECRNYEPKQPFHYDGGGERTHPEPVEDSLDERFNNIIARLESIRAEIKKRNAPKFKVGDWVVKIGNFAENCGTIPTTVKGTVGVIEESDTVYLSDGTSCGRLCIRPATRSDFIVKRNGHEWLAERHDGGIIYIKCDGVYSGSYSSTSPLYHTFINLPVCPAEVK